MKCMEIYKQKEWLYNKRIVEKLTLKDIGDLAGISESAVRYWLKKLDITKPTAKTVDKNVEVFNKVKKLVDIPTKLSKKQRKALKKANKKSKK